MLQPPGGQLNGTGMRKQYQHTIRSTIGQGDHFFSILTFFTIKLCYNEKLYIRIATQ
jgi:hypothetical protein